MSCVLVLGSATLRVMSRPYGSPHVDSRQPQQHGNGRVKLVGYVDTETHAQAKAAAFAGGMSLGLYLAELIKRDQLDHEGRPVWADSARLSNGPTLPGMEAHTAA